MITKPAFLRKVAHRLRKNPNIDKMVFPHPTKKKAFAQPILISAKHLNQKEFLSLISAMVSARLERSKKLITISVKAFSPLTAKVVNTAVVEVFLGCTKEIAENRVKKSTRFFRTQLSEARRKLSDTNERLAKYTHANPTIQNGLQRTDYLRLRSYRIND